jgi:hypothetical protein
MCPATAEFAKTLTGLVTVNNANKIATRLVILGEGGVNVSIIVRGPYYNGPTAPDTSS